MIMMISEESINIIIIFAKFSFSFWPFYFFKIIVQLEATSNTTAQSRFKFNLPTDVLISDEKLVSCLIFSTLQNKHSRVKLSHVQVELVNPVKLCAVFHIFNMTKWK